MLHLLCTLDFEFQFSSDLGADVYDDHRLRFHNINAQHTDEQTIGKVHLVLKKIGLTHVLCYDTLGRFVGLVHEWF